MEPVANDRARPRCISQMDGRHGCFNYAYQPVLVGVFHLHAARLVLVVGCCFGRVVFHHPINGMFCLLTVGYTIDIMVTSTNGEQASATQSNPKRRSAMAATTHL